MVKPRFITDEKGNKKEVLLPIKIWEKLIEELEMAEDIKFNDKAKAKKNPAYISFEEVEKTTESY